MPTDPVPTEPDPYASLTIDALRRRGGVKWETGSGVAEGRDDVIGAWVAEMDFGTAPVITTALHEAVDAGAFGYLADSVADAMREATAGWHRRRYGWDVEPRRVQPLPDVLKGLEVAIEAYSRPGSAVIVPVPAYMPFLTVPALHDRRILRVPMVRAGERWVLDLDALDAAFRDGGHLLVLCNPHNPLGVVATREELAAVTEVVDRHGGRVFADEIHAPLVYAGAQHVPYASTSPVAAGHTLTATSTSKAWNLPGLKCAQLVLSNDADEQVWERVGLMASHGTSTLGVLAATTAFAEGEPWLEETLAYLQGNRDLVARVVAERMPGVRHVPPQGTYLAWLDARALCPEEDRWPGLADRVAREAGVVLVDGEKCGAPGHLRLNVATPRAVLAEALDRLAGVLG